MIDRPTPEVKVSIASRTHQTKNNITINIIEHMFAYVKRKMQTPGIILAFVVRIAIRLSFVNIPTVADLQHANSEDCVFNGE